MLEYALELARKGYYVFQTSPRGKQPCGKTCPNGCKDATRDPDIIRAWFRAAPDANVGIQCENILVLDCDVKNDGNGLESLARISQDLGSISNPVCVTTPSGGVHYYFKRPDKNIAGKTNIEYNGKPTRIDIRVGNQYVIAPGSTLGNGKFYDGDLPDVDELPTLPASWIDHVLPIKDDKPSAPTPAPVPLEGLSDVAERCARYVASLDPAISGQGGHAQFLWAARVIFWGFGLDDETGRRILDNYNSRCQPPFTPKDVEHKIESAKKGDGYGHPFGWLAAQLRDVPVVKSAAAPKSTAAPVPTDARQTADDAEPFRVIDAPQLPTIQINRPEHIIFPFFREAECVLIYAQRGVGKTWFGLTLASGTSEGEWIFGMPIWYAPKPREVLYIDGEMSAADLAERMETIGSNRPHLHFLNPELSGLERGIDLYTDVDQAKILDYAIKHNIEVIFVDNLATLYHCPKPNDSENWRQYDKFILDCRRNGIATVMIDHCGKNNDSGAAGSYAKQNIVNHCIQLDAEAAAGGEGARFWVNFQKSRSCYGTAILPMLLSVRDGKVRHVLRGDPAAEPVEPDDIPLIQTTEPAATREKRTFKKGEKQPYAERLIEEGVDDWSVFEFYEISPTTYRNALAAVNKRRANDGKEKLKSIAPK